MSKIVEEKFDENGNIVQIKWSDGCIFYYDSNGKLTHTFSPINKYEVWYDEHGKITHTKKVE